MTGFLVSQLSALKARLWGRGRFGRPLPRRRRRLSPLTLRIIAINILALAVLLGGLMYLGQYRKSLIESRLDALMVQAEIFASALGESAIETRFGQFDYLHLRTARVLLRRLVAPTRNRARLFNLDGEVVADTYFRQGHRGAVVSEELPSAEEGFVERGSRALYDWIIGWGIFDPDFPPYQEKTGDTARDYSEVMSALRGEPAQTARLTSDGDIVLSVATPVQRYKRVVAGLVLLEDDAGINETLRVVRLGILQVFIVALTVTILLSLYLARSIVRPIRHLAAAAEGVRVSRGRQHVIPDYTARGDEIGELSDELRSMTDALWTRMDAIERFAADVAHEIKNPLSSLRSAVETVARIDDPEKQRELLAIINDDVRRLDRLITDISQASRLDAELSRAEVAPVDIGGILSMLVEVHDAAPEVTSPGDGGVSGVRLALALEDDLPLVVPGLEGRLVQVFRNLLDNAVSFSPPGGVIRIRARPHAGGIEVTIEDSGPGLPPGKMEAVFERFYTERPAGEAFGTHSGLGLSISKQIVDAHNGRIYADNLTAADGTVVGACFTVWLPGQGTPRRGTSRGGVG